MSAFQDLSGQRFGLLTVLRRDGTIRDQTCAAWLCRCDCGETTRVRSSYLKNGQTRSCGCARGPRGFTHRAAALAARGRA